MRTLAFIGSDKNAGKTTTLNFIYRRLKSSFNICVTSIGLNGEKVDQYEFTPKPSITLHPGQFFITSAEHLRNVAGQYTIWAVFGKPEFKKSYILGEPHFEISLVLEGPNEKSELVKIKEWIQTNMDFPYFLIDGSIDRHFLGHPQICDGFFYSLLLSHRKPQQEKAKQLLHPLSFPLCSGIIRQQLLEQETFSQEKSILFNTEGEKIYSSQEIPFLDQKLQDCCLRHNKERLYLYLNGALSRSLHQFLAPFSTYEIILNNFTLYQNIHTRQVDTAFLPRLTLLHPVKIEAIFLKEECRLNLPIPQGIPIHNLFREEIDEIRIDI